MDDFAKFLLSHPFDRIIRERNTHLLIWLSLMLMQADEIYNSNLEMYKGIHKNNEDGNLH